MLSLLTTLMSFVPLLFIGAVILGLAAAACRKSSFWSGACLLVQFGAALLGVLSGAGAAFNSKPKSAAARVSAGLLAILSPLVFVITLHSISLH